MKFQATPEQIKQIALNAINASSPMGLGFLHFENQDYTMADLRDVDTTRGVYLDYVAGRMVKLGIHHVKENTWEMSDNAFPDYQSWASKYTPQSLVESVGAVVLQAA